MKNTVLYSLLLGLLMCSQVNAQTRTVLKMPPNSGTPNALLESLATGPNTLTISAAGTMTFVSGFTLTGGDVLKTALALNAVPNVDATNMSNASAGTLGMTFGGLGADVSAGAGLISIDSGAVNFHPISGGGFASGDAQKIAQYDSGGSLTAASVLAWSGGASIATLYPGRLNFINNGHTMQIQPPSAIAGNYVISLPNVSANATLVTTNDTGSVTNGMLAGSIAMSKLTGTLPAANGGTGWSTLQGSINALMAASGALSQGDVFFYNGTNVVRLAAGTSGYYLQTQGASANPRWAAVSSGLTIGSTVISGGTSGRLLSSGATVGELTLGSGVSTAMGNAVNGTGGLLTYGIIGTSGATVPLLNGANTYANTQTLASGTITASQPALLITQTWNNSSVNFVGVKIAATCTANNTSELFSVYGGTTATDLGLKVINSGGLMGVSLYSMVSSNYGWSLDFFASGLQFGSAKSLSWSSTVNYYDGVDLALSRMGAGMLAQAVGTNAQWLGVFNSRTSGTNWEAGVFDWQTTSNTLRVGSDVGAGGGTARDVQIVRGGVVKETFGSNATSHTQPVKLPSYIVSGLPSAATCGAGSMAFVTDATATTAYTTVAGGGSNKVLVISDGANWIIH